MLLRLLRYRLQPPLINEDDANDAGVDGVGLPQMGASVRGSDPPSNAGSGVQPSGGGVTKWAAPPGGRP